MPWTSQARHLCWRAGVFGRGDHTARLRSGENLVLRPPPTDDLNCAMEIYAGHAYQPPARVLAADVRRTCRSDLPPPPRPVVVRLPNCRRR